MRRREESADAVGGMMDFDDRQKAGGQWHRRHKFSQGDLRGSQMKHAGMAVINGPIDEADTSVKKVLDKKYLSIDRSNQILPDLNQVRRLIDPVPFTESPLKQTEALGGNQMKGLFSQYDSNNPMGTRQIPVRQ